MTIERPTDATVFPMAAEAAYDLSAPYYDSWSWQGFWRDHEYPSIKAILERARRTRGRPLSLLDVGCGTGWYLQQFADLCGEQIGVDLSDGMLAIARHRLPTALLIKSDARRLSFPLHRFDAVLCTRVLSHMQEIETAIKEMRRVLISGGTIVLSDVDATHDYQHTRLPVALGHVFAQTYKHDRTAVFEAVERLGFVPDASFLIRRDGSVEQLRRRGQKHHPSPVAGWIASWRRSSDIRC
ncbi:ubiquinone/menaquinone biosynthesis methyltransferase [Sphingomonas sp. LH128]|uniref:class I SAM-dependent methyltransferase n=1 Tax=Sphingomonas sp. LH128 TaxID=473781 RepID=UPI00027CBEFB|nr:class I SAM-dependent methyltransferase [Sphingomonas sp. LH128]EJU14997.1 ubiquinone/menaquinone biosynthesis methyltransferase [Sphingomonas sp. LH128]